MKHMEYRNRVATLSHLMQLCDSALPVGGFSFSCALESAVAQGVVRDEATLEEFGDFRSISWVQDGIGYAVLIDSADVTTEEVLALIETMEMS